MAKPTPEKSFEMKSRKLVKKIWEATFDRWKNEFAQLSLGVQFLKVKVTGEKETNIHRSFFEDYFKSTSNEGRKITRERIEERLKCLL
jgi:hypothetical protein